MGADVSGRQVLQLECLAGFMNIRALMERCQGLFRSEITVTEARGVEVTSASIICRVRLGGSSPTPLAEHVSQRISDRASGNRYNSCSLRIEVVRMLGPGCLWHSSLFLAIQFA